MLPAKYFTYLKFVFLVFLVLPVVVIGVIGLFRSCSLCNQRERVATILAVNDIYRISGVGKDEMGGLHRLRTLRKIVERGAPGALLLHAGDFLSPSLEGRVFKGEQMVDAMNNLDGSATQFDSRMFVAFGNHEFDDSTCGRSPAPLPQRIAESQFTWLVANLDFSNCASMKDVPEHKNVKRTAVVEVNRIKIGIFGIGLIDTKGDPKYPRYINEYDAARAAIKELRDKNAAVIIALTHLDRKDDEALIRSLYSDGLDLVVGGHDHTQMTIKDAGDQIRGFKADSDARTAWRIDIRVGGKGRPEIEGYIVTLNEAVAPDPEIAALGKKWSNRAQAKICADRAKSGRQPSNEKCLEDRVGKTQFLIELEETPNRSKETAFGRWLAKVVKEKAKADVAIINAGVLGLNDNLEAGSPLLLRQITDIFRFDDAIAVAEFSAKDVCAAIRHGFSKPGTGAWPHIHGVSADGTPSTPEQIQKKWDGPIKFAAAGELNCDSPAKIKVAALPYLLCGGDRYPLMANDDGSNPDEPRSAKTARCLASLKQPGDAAAPLISDFAEAAIRDAPDGIKAVD